ncbi:MAG: pyridoxal phosphate-dependent aminotransferase [Candidatus Hermodarchaeota archaeon]
MTPSPSQRIKSIIAPPIAFLNLLASKIDGVINLGQGVPYFLPPVRIYQSLYEQMQNSKLHLYSSDMGLEELRLALGNILQENKQGTYQPEEIMITAGANQAFANVCLAILDEGDEVLLPSPYYFNHYMAISAVGARAIEWPMRIKTGTFDLDLEKLPELINTHTKAIVVVSPNNPTGCVYPFETVKQIIKFAEENNIFVIFDDTYIDFNYTDIKYDFSKFKYIETQIIHIGSFSKNLGMSGWRQGYIAAKGIMGELLKVQDTLVICAPVISQLAVIEALKWPDYRSFIENKKQEIKQRGLYLTKRLKEVSFLEGGKVEGAFYIFPKILGKRQITSEKLVLALLKRARVLTVPGSAFGTFGEGFLRLAYSFPDIETLEKAIDRLVNFKL